MLSSLRARKSNNYHYSNIQKSHNYSENNQDKEKRTDTKKNAQKTKDDHFQGKIEKHQKLL